MGFDLVVKRKKGATNGSNRIGGRRRIRQEGLGRGETGEGERVITVGKAKYRRFLFAKEGVGGEREAGGAVAPLREGLYEATGDIGNGDGTYAGNRYEELTIMLDALDNAFQPGEVSSRNTDALAFLKVGKRRIEVAVIAATHFA